MSGHDFQSCRKRNKLDAGFNPCGMFSKRFDSIHAFFRSPFSRAEMSREMEGFSPCRGVFSGIYC